MIYPNWDILLLEVDLFNNDEPFAKFSISSRELKDFSGWVFEARSEVTVKLLKIDREKKMRHDSPKMSLSQVLPLIY